MVYSVRALNKQSRNTFDFDFNAEWEKYCNDPSTAKRFIRFGAQDIIKANNDVDVIAINGVQMTDGKNSIPLICGTTFISSEAFPIKNANFHRSGAAHAAPFKGAVPTGSVSPALMKATYSGAVDQITIFTTNFLSDGSQPNTKATVVQAQEFFNCVFTFVDITTFPYLTVFEFVFTRQKITQQDYSQSTEKYGNTAASKVIYEFDYAKGSGIQS